MFTSKILGNGSKVSWLLNGGRASVERLRLRKSATRAGGLRAMISWLPLYITGLYMLDYTETKVGTAIGIPELNPFISNLVNLFGMFAFPIAVLIIVFSMYLLAAQYKGYPKLVTTIAILVAGNETVNVSLNLMSILHQLALLR